MTTLHGFGVSGYRSLRQPMQRVAPLGRVNLIAGQNNSGKSNILRFAAQLLGSGRSMRIPEGLDQPVPPDSTPFAFEVAQRITDEDLASADERARRKGVAVYDTLRSVFDQPLLRGGDDLVWFRYVAPPNVGPGSNAQLSFDPVWLREAQTRSALDLANLSATLYHMAGGPVGQDLARILKEWDPLANLPPVRSVEAFRQITEGDGELGVSTGRGLIQDLHKLQNPPLSTRTQDMAKFQAINHFLQSVLSDPSAQLVIPHDASEIDVQQGDVILPLENLGTGIHQVVIMAAAASLYEDHVICMEEPEVHLHPLLQRKLIRYLTDQTRNQYLIATHSAHLLDYERANVFHVQHGTEGTQVQKAGTPAEVAAVCADLGYRPSDLLQANAVVWVEGPSDRIYLRHWIGLADDELIEGTHYSIMFYGGRLLNHLTARDPEVDDFISLRRLNRHLAILIDSDKKAPGGRIGDTKKRVCSEFDKSSTGFAWLTDGRTIENYVPLELLRTGVRNQAPGAILTYEGDKWDDPLSTETPARIDKVRLARDVCGSWTELDGKIGDLRKKVRATVEFIRQANGL